MKALEVGPTLRKAESILLTFIAGGAVMLQSMAFGGDLGTSLFRQVWLPYASVNDENP